MIYYPPQTYRFSTSEELTQFKEWAETTGLESIYAQLAEIAENIADDNPNRPFEVNLETLLNGLGDAIIAGKVLDNG
mgnify:FL=1